MSPTPARFELWPLLPCELTAGGAPRQAAARMSAQPDEGQASAALPFLPQLDPLLVNGDPEIVGR